MPDLSSVTVPPFDEVLPDSSFESFLPEPVVIDLTCVDDQDVDTVARVDHTTFVGGPKSVAKNKVERAWEVWENEVKKNVIQYKRTGVAKKQLEEVLSSPVPRW